MKKLARHMVLVLFLYLPISSLAQKWEIYDSLPANAFAEAYDGGYFFASYLYLHKTDNNGNILWRKEIGYPRDVPFPCAMVGTKNGGVVMAATSNGVDSNNAATLIKLNACGTQVWSKVYDINVYLDGIGQIALCSNGDLIVSYEMTDYENTHGNWIFRTDSLGNIKYQSFNEIQDMSMLIDRDSNIITTGSYLAKDSVNSSVKYFRCGIAKSSPACQLIWTSLYSITRKIYCMGKATQQSEDGGFITIAGLYMDNGNNVALMLMKTDTAGNVVRTKIIGDTNRYETPIDIEEINNNRYFVAAYSSYKTRPDAYSKEYIKFLIIDSIGNVLKTSTYSNNHWEKVFLNCYKTSDSKFMLCGYVNDSNSNGYYINQQSLDIRINQDLELDSMTTSDRRKYDFLCQDKIPWDGDIFYTGDTIPIKAPSISGITELVSVFNNFSIFPNPANDHIVLHASGLNNEVGICTVYDILGHIFKTYTFYPGSGILSKEIDVSGYEKGVYYVELVQGENRYVQKLVVE